MILDDDFPFQQQQQQQPLSETFMDMFHQGFPNFQQQSLVPRADGFVYFDDNMDNTQTQITTVAKRTTPQIRLKGRGRGRPSKTQKEKDEGKKLPTQREAISTMKDMLELNLLNQDNDRVQIFNGLQQLTNMSVPMNPVFFIQNLNNTIANQQATIQQMHTENFNMSLKYRQDECTLLTKYREEIDALREANNKLREKEEELLEKIRVMTASVKEEVSTLPIYKQPLPTITKRERPREVIKIVKEENSASNEEGVYKWESLKSQDEKCIEIFGFSVQQIDTLLKLVDSLYKPIKSTRGAKQTSDEGTRLLVVLHYERYYQPLVHVSERFGHSKTRLYDIINTYSEKIGPLLFKYTQDDKSVDDGEQDKYYYQRHFIPINRPLDAQKALAYYNEERKSHGVYLHYLVDKKSGKAIKYQISTTEVHTMGPEWSIKDCNCNYNERMIAKFMIMIIRFRGSLQDIEYMCQLTLALCNYDVDCGNPVLESPILEINDQ